jgi:agmatine deiminase
MTTFLAGMFAGLVMMLASLWFVRSTVLPRYLTRLFHAIPKTMRFDLATPQSMKNMITMSVPPFEALLSEHAAGQMLNALRKNRPDLPAKRMPYLDGKSQHGAEVRFFPDSCPSAMVSLPPEYGPLDAILLAWPWHYQTRWAPHADLIEKILHAKARVIVITPNDQDVIELQTYLNGRISDVSGIVYLSGPVDDVWIRDYGPTFVKQADGSFAIIANPYLPSEHPYRKGDNAVSFSVGAALALPVYRLPLVIEGGNMVTDGHGLMVVTTAVTERNPEFDQDAVRQMMADYFGCSRTLFIEHLPAEVTGHADMVVRFLDAHTVIVASAPKGHRWAPHFDRIAAQFARTKAHNGTVLQIHRMPIAVSPKHRDAFWSYVNCLQVNGTVIVPTFGLPADEPALELYRSITNGPVEAVNFSDFLVGSAHCQTKEVPAGALTGGTLA